MTDENATQSVHRHVHTHHQHGPAADTEFDWDSLASTLTNEGQLFAAVADHAVRAIADNCPQPRRILDLGSGPGMAATIFAQAFPKAEVIAVDGSTELLRHASRLAHDQGTSITTMPAQLPADFAMLPPADVIWSANFLHHLGNQKAAIDIIGRKLNKGGIAVIAEGGLPMRWLPRDYGLGNPDLELRLAAAQSQWFNRMRAQLPETTQTVEDWSTMLHDAGMTPSTTNVLIDHPAPLGENGRTFLQERVERTLDMTDCGLDDADIEALRQLSDPANPLGIQQRQDIHLLTVKTLHIGIKN